MSSYLYRIVIFIAEIHEKILALNDAYEYNFTDKELHFLVIGALGIGLLLVIYPFFLLLARKNHVLVIAWIYVFTVILCLTFAIEIGQKITHTGKMEFADIVFGVVGFLFMFLIFVLLRGIWHGILYLIRRLQRKK